MDLTDVHFNSRDGCHRCQTLLASECLSLHVLTQVPREDQYFTTCTAEKPPHIPSLSIVVIRNIWNYILREEHWDLDPLDSEKRWLPFIQARVSPIHSTKTPSFRIPPGKPNVGYAPWVNNFPDTLRRTVTSLSSSQWQASDLALAHRSAQIGGKVTLQIVKHRVYLLEYSWVWIYVMYLLVLAELKLDPFEVNLTDSVYELVFELLDVDDVPSTTEAEEFIAATRRHRCFSFGCSYGDDIHKISFAIAYSLVYPDKSLAAEFCRAADSACHNSACTRSPLFEPEDENEPSIDDTPRPKVTAVPAVSEASHSVCTFL